jgi:hypothetical protein
MSYFNNLQNNYGMGLNSAQNNYNNNLYQQNGFMPNRAYYNGNTGIVYATFEEVSAEKLYAGDVIMRIDRAGDILYIKSADSLGRTNIDVYDLIKRTDEKVVKNYITKEEVQEMITQAFQNNKQEPTQINEINQ